MSQKKVYVTETSFCQKKLCQRKNYPQKKNFITETSFGHKNKFFLSYPKRNTFLSQKKVPFTEQSFCHRQQKSVREKIFRHRSKFLSQKNSVTETSFRHKKVSFTETSFCNRNKSCPHPRPLQLKVLKNLFLLFLAHNFCHHLYCHLAFFLEQSERTTFADLI